MSASLSDLYYKPHTYNINGLMGTSDKTTAMHYGLYEGYVSETNKLTDRLSLLSSIIDSTDDTDNEIGRIKKRLAFEYNGMLLHEYFFENLKANAPELPAAQFNFMERIKECFETFDKWKTDFINTSKIRGPGWVICYEDPSNGKLTNNWITLHDEGAIVGFHPILVLDLWEHAYMLDYKPSRKEAYVEDFFLNIDWVCLENRLTPRTVFE